MTAVRHIITGEFPPSVGGVAGYTAAVARGLADAGEDVHVWTSGRDATPTTEGRVTVHRRMGTFDRRALNAADGELDRFPRPRRLLLQWVPHAYGRSSMNLAFCFWVRHRVRRHGDVLDVMVHEPFLPFGHSASQTAAAAVHRLMVRVLFGAASKIYVATTAWEALCRPYAKGVSITWTPVPSGIAVTAGAEARAEVREALDLPAETALIGAFGRAGAAQRRGLAECLGGLDGAAHPGVVLLIGSGSDDGRRALVAEHPGLAGRIRATGPLSAHDVSRYLRACDIVVQPYADGICGRHSSAMAALAHGCAIVTTEGRFTEPVWRQSGAVSLVPAGDATQLAQAVLALATRPAERAQLGRRARGLYERCFDVRHTVSVVHG